MKKMLIGLLAIFAVFGLISLNANAISNNNNNQQNDGFVSVNVEKKKEVSPDTAEVTFTVETRNKVLKEASEKNKEKISAIYNAINPMKNDKNKLTIKTGSYSAHPNYIYQNNKEKLQDYTVVNSVIIKTKDVENIGVLVDKAINAGADRVSSMSFSFEDNGISCHELLQEATKEAKTRATLVTQSAGQTVSGIKSIGTSCSVSQTNGNIRMYANSVNSAFGQMKAAAMEDSEIETQINPGKITIKAYINADFYVK